jgi:hypothetical protein
MASNLITLGIKLSRTFLSQCFLAGLLSAWLLTGCSTQSNLTLMPKPVIYQNGVIDPFAHLTPEHQTTRMRVFYATNRVPRSSESGVSYGNALDSSIHLGEATIRMGEPDADWEGIIGIVFSRAPARNSSYNT